MNEPRLGPDQVAAVALGNAAESGLGSSLEVLARMCDELRLEAECTAMIDLVKLQSVQRSLDVLARYAPHMQRVALSVGRDRGAALHLVLHPTTFE